MAAGRLIIPGWMRALDSDGDPISARVSLFTTGTDALASVYADEGLSIPLANPVESNSAGRFPAIWASDAVTYDWSVEAPYGPPGNPFTGTGLTTALAADVLIAEAAEAAAAEAAADAVQTAADLAAIEAIIAAGSDAPAIAGKLDRDGANIGIYAPDLRTAIGAVSSTALAASSGAGLVGFMQSGTGAVARTVQTKARDVINAADFGLTGTGDETATLQALLTAHAGKTIDLDGTYTVSSTVTVAGNNTTLRFRNGAGITYATATLIPFAVTGDNVTIEGMTVNAPATFDGTNTQPLYGCIWVTGDNCRIIGATLNNVPKVGISFTECEGGRVSQTTINGNYPTGSFTGTEVGHAGILIDCASTGRQGNFIIESNSITTCVQGLLIANYGATSRSQGIIIAGNNFYSIWNHGVYGAGINYANVVTGNTFIFCQVPVALSGSYHVVSDNTLTTGGSSGLYTDQTGISLRDPQHCVVSGNTLQGETGTNQILINLTVSLGTVVRGNIVQGNTCEITGSGSATMIALGGTTCTDLTDNLVQGNVCKGPGRLEIGLITLSGAASCPAQGTRVSHNSGVAKSASHGVQLINLIGAVADNNSFRLEYDSAGVVQVCGVDMSACVGCEAHDNPMSITAAWGTNLQLVGIRESTSGSGNRAWKNSLRADPTKIVYGIPYFTVSGSGIFVDDGGAGAPNLSAGLGSTWRKTDGLTPYFYVKEVGTDAAGWVGK